MASLPLAAEDGVRGGWLLPALVLAGGLGSIAVIAVLAGGAPPLALLLGLSLSIVALAGLPLVIGLFRRNRAVVSFGERAGVDWVLVASALDDGPDAVVVTDHAASPVCANRNYEAVFEGLSAPLDVGTAPQDRDALAGIAHQAWRDGAARLDSVATTAGPLQLAVRRSGIGEDYLLWRFSRVYAHDGLADAVSLVEGPLGRRLGAAGVMAAAVDAAGALHAANPVFLQRAVGDAAARAGRQPVMDLIGHDEDDRLRLLREPAEQPPIRAVHVPMDDAEDGPALLLMLDEDVEQRPRSSASASVYGLLSMLPLGLALAERDGRFLFMNAAFGRAAGVPSPDSVLYPSDLVVDEDKGTVSEAVRRFAQGRALPGDLAVRLRAKPEEPVALTIAGATGLGDAAVLLSLKDNSEESRLKRQVAQATKMQAVGQLAGGVAHDFNNVLTAIIGHCDLMLMRHRPGDIDHDDIQQIRLNSNRAASLTRQLLAFSRQQTLRPQVLQLPDVISEVSHLLKRLLGETITLTAKHGRNLGYVRADPGQLEQVIVNLAVNARDAMPDGGTVALQTYAMSAADVRRLGSDILPVADYVALSVSDTGHGIPPEILGKIFEPFFTTKEVGKGTGLGLSTVYGIVKQTGGFIFADSAIGEGTRFVIYLPVHQSAAVPVDQPKPAKPEPAGDLWGTGTILLVEDEAMVRSVAERALSRQGYRVLTATNGEEALEVIGQGEAIDLLVSDVVMPTMDGPTMVRHARERLPDLPILFMSGYAEEQLRRSIDITSVAFLAKPFSVQQLCAAARDVLAAKKG